MRHMRQSARPAGSARLLLSTVVETLVAARVRAAGIRQGERTMNIDRSVFAFAGAVVLASIALSQVHSLYWLLLTAFVGLNMLQAAFTGFCPLALVLKRLGVRPGHAFR